MIFLLKIFFLCSSLRFSGVEEGTFLLLHLFLRWMLEFEEEVNKMRLYRKMILLLYVCMSSSEMLPSNRH
jgi:hypothetical protein